MIAAVINMAAVILGSLGGLLFRNRINERHTDAIMKAMALCVLAIGVMNAIKTQDMLCMIICMGLGTILGELLRIEDRLDSLGDTLKNKVMRGKGGGRFTEGFMGATLLFCVGSMAVIGSIQAGINHDYSIILSKSVIDCISAVVFAAAMGVGVMFSAFGVLIYQGLLTLLAIWVGPILPDAVVTEMSAVGGLLIVALSFNMLGVGGDRKLKVGNLLPAVFLPVIYVPLAGWIGGLLG